MAQHELGRPSLAGHLISKRFPHWAVPDWLKVVKIGYDDPVIDVGSGIGYMLLELRERGYTNLTGIDPYLAGDLNYPNGVTIYKRTMSEVTDKYKVVHSSQVFEHLDDPEESLRDFSRLVAPGGTIVISVPVFPNELWRRYRTNWIGLDVPRHLFLHNQKTMEILASRTGLKVESVSYCTTGWCFTASEGYVKGIPFAKLNPDDYLSVSQIANFKREAVDLNARGLADQATFYLRKV
jgi:SAM-dependent methyltransferase